MTHFKVNPERFDSQRKAKAKRKTQDNARKARRAFKIAQYEIRA